MTIPSTSFAGWKKLKPQWDAEDILPNESIPAGDKTREPHRYGMPLWRKYVLAASAVSARILCADVS